MDKITDNKYLSRRRTRTFALWIAILLITVMTGIPVKAASTKQITGVSRYDYAYEVLERTNAERTKRGKSALVMDKTLLQASMLRAAECAVKFDHLRPNGKDCFTICSKIYAENLAYGQESPKEVVGDWVKSSGHRTNLLNSKYKSIGIGCFEYKGKIYWVQSYGKSKGTDYGEPYTGETVYQIALAKSEKTKVVSGASATPNDPLASKIGGFKAAAGKKKLTLTWNKKSGVTGYEIQASNNKSFKNADTYKLTAARKKLVINKYKGKKLSSKKKYYVRIRSYIKVEVRSNTSSAQTASDGTEDSATSQSTTSNDTSSTTGTGTVTPTYTEKVGYTFNYSKWKAVNKKTK